MFKNQNYTRRNQRATYLITIRFDVREREYPLSLRKRYFDQIGVGRRVFGHFWDYWWFRLSFEIALPIIMIFLDIYFPLSYTVKLFFHTKKTYSFTRLFLEHERRLFLLSKNAGLQKGDDVWFHSPFDFKNFSLPDYFRSIEIVDLVNLSDIWACAYQAIFLHFLTICRYGYDKYFLSLRAYEWCLTDCALRHVSPKVELYYACMNDRMAIMFDRLPHKMKIMIPHGKMYSFHKIVKDSPYYRWNEEMGFYYGINRYRSSPNIIYCPGKMEEVGLQCTIIANQPKYIYTGYGFKPAFKPEGQSVLIVANYTLFSEQEKIVLEKLQSLPLLIYVKNHPANRNSYYYDLQRSYKFILIEGLDTNLPDVDVVISYDSTLAYEYKSIGTKVVFYEDIDVNNIGEIIMRELKVGS